MAAFEQTVEFRRYFRIAKSSPEPLDARSIEIRIAADPPPAPSPPAPPATARRASASTAAALLWAHFEACRRGELAQEGPAPWERLGCAASDPVWIRFLDAVVRGGDIAAWIGDMGEVRRRAVEAFEEAAREAERTGGARRATYRDIQRWVLSEYGFRPHPSWIAGCKQLCGLPVRAGTGRPQSRRSCPEGKRPAIEAAFRHFGLLPPREG